MDCSYFRARLNQFVDGELGYIEVAELQGHLSFCPHCAAELAQLSEVRGAMADVGRGRAGAAAGLRGARRGGCRPRAQAGRGHRGARRGRRARRARRTRSAASRCPAAAPSPSRTSSVYGIAATAVLIQVERYLRRTRELKPL